MELNQILNETAWRRWRGLLRFYSKQNFIKVFLNIISSSFKCPCNKKDMSIICKNCGRSLRSQANLANHSRACERFYRLKDEISKDFFDGKTYKEISNIYDIDMTTLSELLINAGILKVKEDYFKKINNSEKAWLLGLLAADGCVKRGNRLVLSQSGENGLKLIQHVRKILGVRNKIGKYKPKAGETAYSISVVSDNIIKDLKKYNIIPNKSLIYEFPKKLPKKYIKDFIRGYFEGDGCVCIYKRKCGYIGFTFSFVGTRPFIEAAQEYLPVKTSIWSPTNKSTVIGLTIGNGKALDLCKWLFSTENLYLSYKYEKYLKYFDYYTGKQAQKAQ